MEFINNGTDISTWKYVAANLPNDVIIKSLNKSDLVQVQRTVSKHGTTFIQKFWIKPEQVKDTDKVINGQENMHLHHAKAFMMKDKNFKDFSAPLHEMYKFISVGDKPLTKDTHVDPGVNAHKAEQTINQFTAQLVDKFEHSVEHSYYIGDHVVDSLSEEDFQKTYGITKDEYYKTEHIEFPDHFHIDPQITSITPTVMAVQFNTSLDYDKLTPGTIEAIKQSFTDKQITGMELKNDNGKLLIQTKFYQVIEPTISDDELTNISSTPEGHIFFGAWDDEGYPATRTVSRTAKYPPPAKVHSKSPYGKWLHSANPADIHQIEEYTYSAKTYPTNNLMRGIPHPGTSYGWRENIELALMKGNPKVIERLDTKSIETYRIHSEGCYCAEDKPKIKAMVEGMDRAISTAEVPKPFRAYRSISRYLPDGTDLLEKFLHAGYGGVVTEGGFTSSTPIKGSFEAKPPKISLKIRVPAGKGIGVWAEPLTRCMRENEFIFASNSAFRVLTHPDSINPKADDISIEVEYIGREDKPFEDIWNEAVEKGLVKEMSNRTKYLSGQHHEAVQDHDDSRSLDFDERGVGYDNRF